MRSYGPVTIGRQRTAIEDPPGAWAERFRKNRSIPLRRLIEHELLESLQASCTRAAFSVEGIPGLGTREVEKPQRIGAAIRLMLGRSEFLEWVGNVTGCIVNRIEGQLVQTRASSTQQLDWHDDMNKPERRVGITLSLSTSVFEGGWFELRETATERVVGKHRHEKAGDALLFEIGPHLQHRLLPITAGGPRRVFTGWFTED